MDWSELYGTQVVDCFTELGWCQHLKIWRHDGAPLTCDWSTLQAIKDELLGTETTAIEFYPPADQVVDDVNYRHLWSIPLPLPMRPSRRI
jgi:hypothetical protein